MRDGGRGAAEDGRREDDVDVTSTRHVQVEGGAGGGEEVSQLFCAADGDRAGDYRAGGFALLDSPKRGGARRDGGLREA